MICSRKVAKLTSSDAELERPCIHVTTEAHGDQNQGIGNCRLLGNTSPTLSGYQRPTDPSGTLLEMAASKHRYLPSGTSWHSLNSAFRVSEAKCRQAGCMCPSQGGGRCPPASAGYQKLHPDLDVLREHALDVVGPLRLAGQEGLVRHERHHVLDIRAVRIRDDLALCGGAHPQSAKNAGRMSIPSIAHEKQSTLFQIRMSTCCNSNFNLPVRGVLAFGGNTSKEPRPTTKVRSSRASGNTKP